MKYIRLYPPVAELAILSRAQEYVFHLNNDSPLLAQAAQAESERSWRARAKIIPDPDPYAVDFDLRPRPRDHLVVCEALRRRESLIPTVGIATYSVDGRDVVSRGASLEWHWRRGYLAAMSMPSRLARHVFSVAEVLLAPGGWRIKGQRA